MSVGGVYQRIYRMFNKAREVDFLAPLLLRLYLARILGGCHQRTLAARLASHSR